MPHFQFTQNIGQLEKRKGGYFYLKIDAEVVEQFEKKRATRLKCDIDGKVSYSCGLNHLGDGNFFIIVATRHLKKLGKELGDEVQFEIYEDPNPLGVEIPEVLQVLLQQDEDAKVMFEQLTDGKKRSLIYAIKPVKNIDKQVEKIMTFLVEQSNKRK
ncbi:MAG: YdeI/OmpD-associated family protein [Bacteroidota bacterium]